MALEVGATFVDVKTTWPTSSSEVGQIISFEAQNLSTSLTNCPGQVDEARPAGWHDAGNGCVACWLLPLLQTKTV